MLDAFKKFTYIVLKFQFLEIFTKNLKHFNISFICQILFQDKNC